MFIYLLHYDTKLKIVCIQEANPEAQPLLLVQDVCTRWNSTYYMLERFVVKNNCYILSI